jgi:PAS domain S-box-containing protein
MISSLVLGSFLLLVTASEIITNQWIQNLNVQEELAAQIERQAYELGYLANDYLHYRESQQADRWESKFASFSENLGNMEVNTPEQRALLANLKKNQQRLKSVFADVRASIEGAPQTQVALVDTEFMQVSWSRLEVQNQGLIFDASRLEGLLREQEDRLRRTTSLYSFVLIAVLGGFLLGNYGLTFRRTLKSIAELQAGTRTIGSGNLDFAIAVKNEDEIGELSRAFNQMTASLKEVTASKADLEREITERKRVEEALRYTNERLQDQTEELEVQSEELRLQTEELAFANQQLHESEARFRLALTHAPVSVATQDCDLVYTWAYNQKTRRKDEILGRTDVDLFPPEAAHLTELKRRVLDTGENISEQLWVTSNDQQLFLDLFIEPLRNERGKIEGVGLATVDLTQVKLAEQRIAAHTSETQAANEELKTARLAALNLIEDTLRAQEELQKVNAMLRESEKRLNRAQEIANLGSWELDLVNNRLSWSDEVYRIFGLEPQEFGATYDAFLEAVHPDDRAAVDAAYSGSIRDGLDSYEIEHRVVQRASGEMRVVHEKCEHFQDEGGQIVRSVGMVHDITEQVQAEEALRAAHDELELRVQERTKDLAVANQKLLYEIYEREEIERQLRIQTTAMEAAANGILITDLEGDIQWANPALTHMTGYTNDDLIDQNMRLFKSGQHDHDYYRRMWATALAGQVWHGETINRRKDGSLYTEEQTIAPVRGEDGQISHFIAIKQDITEHKQIEAALELERVRLKNILDTIPDGVYIINQEYDIEYANPVIEREFSAIDERKCYAYFHDLLEPCPWCKNEEVFARMQLTREHTYAKNKKSYEIFDAPLVNSDGSLSKLKLLHDITQRKKMGLDLERSNQELQAASSAERKQRQLAEALVQAALVLNKSQELDEVLTIILEQIRLVIPYQFADIGLLEGEAFYDASHQGDAELTATQVGIMQRYLLDDFPLLKNMCQSGEPVLIPDTEQEPDWVISIGFEWCRSFLSAPLIVEKQVIGFVNLFASQTAFYTEEMCDRLVAFASHAAAAIQNAWLFEQVRASSERLQSLSRRLVEVQENERLYIARELHDEAGQMLTSLLVDLRLLEKEATRPKAILKIVNEMESSLNSVIENLHRVAMALRPASLDHVGLVAALRQHVETIGEKQGLRVSFDSKTFRERLPANVETVLYRIVQESLTNVVRHAHASQVDVILTVRNKKLVVIVEDDGIGFDPESVSTGEHLGLFGMRERAEMIDGKLVIESAHGKGTTIMVEVDYVDTNIDR